MIWRIYLILIINAKNSAKNEEKRMKMSYVDKRLVLLIMENIRPFFEKVN